MALDGILLSAGILVNSPQSLDTKYGPFNSTGEALSEISSLVRYPGLTVGILNGGQVVEYWFKDGVNLVEKTSGGLGGGSIYYQDTAPALGVTGETWIRTTDMSEFHWYDENWVRLKDEGGNKIYYQDAAPALGVTGQTWIRTTDMSEFHWYDENWVRLKDEVGGGGGSIYYQDTAPALGVTGETWIRTTDMSEFHWYDENWVRLKDGSSEKTTYYQDIPPITGIAGEIWIRTTDLTQFNWYDGFWVRFNI
jgi:hypothetical protein